MLICNLEHGDSRLKTPRSLWRCYSDEPVTRDTGDILNFTGAYNSNSFRFKRK